MNTNLGTVENYIPNNAYSILLPVGTELSDFGNLPVQAVSIWSPEMKMTSRLYTLDLPSYVLRSGDQFEVLVKLHQHINTYAFSLDLAKEGYSVVGYNEAAQSITLNILPTERASLASHSQISYVQLGEEPGEPENFNATRSARSRAVNTRFSGGMHYDGSGVVVGHGDDGDIGPHIDYTGRIIARNTSTSTGDHGDHVAGTIFGAGNLDPDVQGMAPGAELFYYTYPRNLNFVDAAYSNQAVRITNSSYSNGCNAGYTSFTQQVDEDIVQNPKLMHVFSAGNSGTTNCGYGAGSSWGNVTGGHKIGKNVIATANITATDGIASSSSRGPSADGRIKPDIASVGSSVYSTIDPNTYGYKTGTSMAAPGVAGAMTQMFQAFVETQGSEPDGGLLKAFLMNTADDLGKPGPDFIYGYGRMNILRGIRDIENTQYIIDSVSTSQADSFQISVPSNTAEFRVMVYWTDPAASPSASRVLVNNLDAVLRAPNGTNYQPWVLDPTPNATNLNANAVRATDSLNNAEQITLSSPATGDYWIKVNGSNVPMGPQKYYIVYSIVEDKVELTYPFGGETLEPNSTEVIYWDASTSTQGFTLEYSTDAGANWNSIGTANAGARQFTWTNTPNLSTDSLDIRITRGSQSDMTNSPAVMIAQPNGLALVQACPDSMVVRWDAVSGAQEYEVYLLGQKYMDSIARTPDTFYVFHNLAPNVERWWSVAAVPTIGGATGKRAIAKMKDVGLRACVLNSDVALFSILSPQSSEISSCHNLDSMNVEVRLRNGGLVDHDTIVIGMQFDGGAIAYDTLFSILQASTTLDYTVANTIDGSATGVHQLKVWAEVNVDDNVYNDTAEVSFTVSSGGLLQTAPIVQNFDSWSSCSNATDCGGTSCTLFNYWSNSPNGGYDDIDFRTFSGATSSSGTGPNFDHTTGSGIGRYLYLEASGSCTYQWAQLYSPCIDLGTLTLPQMEFYYHMRGADIGELHVDIFSDGNWTLDVINPIIGDQGNSWIAIQTNLSQWVGKIITVRFRASTGGDYQGDLAIDDFSIKQAVGAPVADFDVSNASPCLGEVVALTDMSSNVPSSWNWSITPNTFSFVNGTSSTTQNPEVVFNAMGTYTVKLVASSVNGTDSMTTVGAVSVNAGASLPFVEEFEGASFAPLGWTITNQDQLTTWEAQTCYGYNSLVTTAARLNNYNYTSSGQEDGLVSPSINLGSTTNPALVFDLAYIGTTSNKNDRLKIEVSTDCGATWDNPVYNRTGSALTTVNINQTIEYIPAGSSHWRRDTIDLSSYSGQEVKIRFVNITDGGNALYLDNIQLYDLSVTPPTSAFTTAYGDTCLGSTFTFTYPGTTASNVDWDFGNNATPSTATGVGPHNVQFTNSGIQLVNMIARNAGGTVASSNVINVKRTANARFTYGFVANTAGYTVQFNSNLSSGIINSYWWDFGDGTTDTVPNPVHTYSTNVSGSLPITLVLTNDCGTDTVVNYVHSITIEENGSNEWILAPNPAQSTISLSRANGQLDVSEAVIYSINGAKVFASQSVEDNAVMTFDISALPSGIYLLNIQTDKGSEVMRFVVER